MLIIKPHKTIDRNTTPGFKRFPYDGDLGYPRSLVRPDGKVMTIYYFNGPREEDRAIEATLWKP